MKRKDLRNSHRSPSESTDGITDSREALKKMTRKILRTMELINEKYPELSIFMNEMNDGRSQVQSDESEFNLLDRYYQSLTEILIRYRQTHPAQK